MCTCNMWYQSYVSHTSMLCTLLPLRKARLSENMFDRIYHDISTPLIPYVSLYSSGTLHVWYTSDTLHIWRYTSNTLHRRTPLIPYSTWRDTSDTIHRGTLLILYVQYVISMYHIYVISMYHISRFNMWYQCIIYHVLCDINQICDINVSYITFLSNARAFHTLDVNLGLTYTCHIGDMTHAIWETWLMTCRRHDSCHIGDMTRWMWT